MKWLKYLTLVVTIVCFGCPASAQNFGKRQLVSEQGHGNGKHVIDMDNDGDLDLAAFPVIHLNDGKGAKSGEIVVSTNLEEVEHWAVGDVNNDDLPDIVVLYHLGRIEVHINAVDGFKLQKYVEPLEYYWAEYAKIRLIDVNHDNKVDIVIDGLTGSNKAFVGDGAGSFVKFPAFNKAFPKTSFFTSIDITGNGIKELLIPESSKEQPVENYLSAFRFEQDKYVKVGKLPIKTWGVTTFKEQDVDQDGDLDILLSSEYQKGVYWIERKGEKTFTPARLLVKDVEAEYFEYVDLDDDGDFDLIYKGTNVFGKIRFMINKGKGIYEESTPHAFKDFGKDVRFIVSDLNGDNINDLFVFDYDDFSGTSTQVYLKDKQGKTTDKLLWNRSSSPNTFEIIDLNNDGFKDIVLVDGGRIYYRNGSANGTLDSPVDILTMPFTVVDLVPIYANKDSLVDLLLVGDDRAPSRIKLIKNLGENSFGRPTTVLDLPGRLKEVYAVDFDHDGDEDIVFNYWNKSSYDFCLYTNDGTGRFSSNYTEIAHFDDFNQLGVLDVNNDGKPELIDENTGDYVQYSSGKFIRGQLPFGQSYNKTIFELEVDNDDNPDYVELGFKALKWFEKDDEGNWTDSIIFKNSHDIDWMVKGDIDNDGDDDLICYYSDRVMVDDRYESEILFHDEYSMICLVNNNGKFEMKTLFPCETLSHFGLLDVDNDGDLDIITTAYHYPFGGISLYPNLLIE